MEQLKELNGGKTEVSRSMVTFLAVNTSSITSIPTTVIAIRMNYQAASPTDIVGPTLVATCFSGIAAIRLIVGFTIVDPGRERDDMQWNSYH